ncbi:MAG: OB-fold domain-containing protein [Proteobacteria bacterium]|nr:OB-fold domain-containing protein [Pseudomonadota bacterium]
MSDVSKGEIIISRTYPTIGLDLETVVQPGLFNYPLANGEKAALLANRCRSCGRTFFPKRSLCPECFVDGEMEEVKLDTRGIIYSTTVVTVPSPAGIKPPYAYGYVDLPANNVRVFALFAGADPRTFVPGQEVDLVVEPIMVNKQGQKVIGYKFRKVL